MDYKEKYENALNRAKKFKEHLLEINDEWYANEIDCMFPELKVSEDEMMVRKLKDCLKQYTAFAHMPVDKVIAWLEKQGEQKPEWSDEDKKQLERAIYMMEQLDMTKSWDDVYNWLKSLKNRVQPHWKPTDEQMQALELVVQYHAFADQDKREKIVALFNDLKKL